MSFGSFSKDFAENSFTSVENRFITKYLPEASGDAVRVYLFGLYLCASKEELDGESAAKLLHIPYSALVEIYDFWEECGLVQVLSRDPIYVEYLPVSAAMGKPKPLRPEKYADFNRALFKLLQRAGKDLRPYEQQRILEFLENNPMEHEAFLLVVEYYVKKQGEKLTVAHILNAANKLVREHKYTYEQVEAEYADYRAGEQELSRILQLLGIRRRLTDDDYRLYSEWVKEVEPGAVTACAEALKKGSMETLGQLVGELIQHGLHSEREARDYLRERESLATVVFKVAQKLGIKVQNPRPYIEEYASKWIKHGYREESLTMVAALGLRLSYGFQEYDTLLEKLYNAGIVDPDRVKAYCSARAKQFKLLQSIQSICGVVKKSEATLDMIAEWRNWGFSEEMILEAAKRSANAASPLPYMNKLLSDWKQAGAFTPSEIPADGPYGKAKSEVAAAIDERAVREQFYTARREAALGKVARVKETARKDRQFAEAERAIRDGERELAKAELYDPSRAPSLREALDAAHRNRAEALARLHLTEEDFIPVFVCKKCSDTGFLPDGHICDCYPKSS